MPRVVQEKFEVRYPAAKDDNGNEWVSDKSVRVKKGLVAGSSAFYGGLPPGTDIEDQENIDSRVLQDVTAGTTDVTDNPSGRDFAKGHVSLPMRQTDDMYTREHNDAFYDDVGGFVERNNMLDRY